MIRLARPSESSIAQLLSPTSSGFSHPEVGATARPAELDRLASRYTIDRRRFALAPGRAVFERAGVALLAWRHFEIPWLELHGATVPAFAGQQVATLTRFLGLWFVNPCRVVYVEAPSQDPDGVAFAYGTLPGHVAQGEERFSVRHDPATGGNTFEIVAFSRPAILLARLGRPLLRRTQKRFAPDVARALEAACRSGSC